MDNKSNDIFSITKTIGTENSFLNTFQNDESIIERSQLKDENWRIPKIMYIEIDKETPKFTLDQSFSSNLSSINNESNLSSIMKNVNSESSLEENLEEKKDISSEK